MAYYDISGRLEITTSSEQEVIIELLMNSLRFAKANASIVLENGIEFQVPFLKTVTRGYILQGISSGSISLSKLQFNAIRLEYKLKTLPMRVTLMVMAIWTTIVLPSLLFFRTKSASVQSYSFALINIAFTAFFYFAGKFFIQQNFKSFIKRSILKEARVIKQPFLGNSLDIKRVVIITCSGILMLAFLIPSVFIISILNTRSKMLWRYAVGNTVMSAPVVSNNDIYFGSLNDSKTASFYALDITTGRKKWARPLSDASFWSPVITDEAVYFSTDDGFLYGVNRESGKELWKFGPEQRSTIMNQCNQCALKFSPPIIDNNVIYLGSLDHNLYAINALTGTLKWHFAANGSIFEPPMISQGKAYIGSYDGYIYVIEIQTGIELQRYFVPFQNGVNSESGVFATPLMDTNSIYAINGSLVALDIRTGNIKWQFSDPSPYGQITGNAFMFDDYIVATTTEAIYAIDKATGRILWKFSNIKGSIFSQPTLHDGIVYFGDSSGYLYAINAKTGRQVHRYNMNFYDLSSYTNFVSEFVFQPVVDENTIYVGWNNDLYAIRNDN
jgi:outer membrane protein assembly factor BamB